MKLVRLSNGTNPYCYELWVNPAMIAFVEKPIETITMDELYEAFKNPLSVKKPASKEVIIHFTKELVLDNGVKISQFKTTDSIETLMENLMKFNHN